jgi:acyl carrier protein
MENKITREDILKLVLSTLETYCIENDISVNLSQGEELKLFGGESLLDSLGLVSLIVSIEEAIEDKFNTSIILADEKAMSRRTSPFSRVSYLVDYILELINAD